MADKSTMAPGSAISSSVDATSRDPQSATPNIRSAQRPFDTFPVDDVASHFYDNGAFQLFQTTATFDMPADHTALLDQPARLPVIDESALDPMLIVDHGDLLHNPLLSATIYDSTSSDMMPIDDLNPLHNPLLPTTMYGNASSDVVPIDDGALFAGPLSNCPSYRM